MNKQVANPKAGDSVGKRTNPVEDQLSEAELRDLKKEIRQWRLHGESQTATICRYVLGLLLLAATAVGLCLTARKIVAQDGSWLQVCSVISLHLIWLGAITVLTRRMNERIRR